MCICVCMNVCVHVCACVYMNVCMCVHVSVCRCPGGLAAGATDASEPPAGDAGVQSQLQPGLVFAAKRC